MKNAIFILACACALVSSWSQAQTPSPTDQLPPGPLIVPAMPDMAQWSIDFTYKVPSTPESVAATLAIMKQNAQQDPVLAKALTNPQYVFAVTRPRPKRIVITKTGAIRHEETEFERSIKGESWQFDGNYVVRQPNYPALNAIGSEGITPDFPEFGWINAANFVGIKKVGPTDCLTFKQDLAPAVILTPRDPKGPTGSTQLVPVTAYVDLQTRQPVALVFDGEPRRYTMASSPLAALVVPEDFITAAKVARAHADAAIKLLSPP